MNLRLFFGILIVLLLTFSVRVSDVVLVLVRDGFSLDNNVSEDVQTVTSSMAFAESSEHGGSGGAAGDSKGGGKSEEKGEPVPVPEGMATPEEIQETYADSDAQPDPYVPRFSDAEVEVLETLASRREELDKRARELDQQALLLKATENRVDEKLAEMNALRDELEALLQKQTAEQQQRLDKLVKIYENMKPKDAAGIFDELELDVLLGILDRMSERKSAPIIAAMDPVKARIISLKLAEQKALPE